MSRKKRRTDVTTIVNAILRDIRKSKEEYAALHNGKEISGYWVGLSKKDLKRAEKRIKEINEHANGKFKLTVSYPMKAIHIEILS